MQPCNATHGRAPTIGTSTSRDARPAGPTEPIDRYRRLVVNPLLAVAGFVGAVLILRAALRSRNLTAFLTAVGLLGVSLLFTQIHCLDCGATTWLFAAKRHACEPALARWREGRPVRGSVSRRKDPVGSSGCTSSFRSRCCC